MARNKSKSDHAKIAALRLMEDEEVQKQLRIASTRLHEAWSRASGRSPAKAASDKKVYAKVREAAVSLTAAGGRLRKQPEPPKRTGRKVVVAVAVAGGATYAAMKMRRNGTSGEAQYNGQNAASPSTSVPESPTPVT
jgi:hypothetical protein